MGGRVGQMGEFLAGKGLYDGAFLKQKKKNIAVSNRLL